MKSIYATIALITDCIKVIIDYFNHSIFCDRLIISSTKINDYLK